MKVKLRDVSNIIMGQSPDSSTYNTENIGLPFFQGNADFGELNPIAKTWCSAPIKIAYKNYILISVRAPIGALNIAAETCCIGRGLAALDVNNKICTQKYLWYLLEAKKNELISKGTGSTFKAISKNILSEMEFNIPPVREQELCTKTLDVVFCLIRLKKEQLDKLDLLVKSRFIEMFGDPITNDKELPVEPLGKHIELLGGFAFKSTGFTKEGIPVLRIGNINSGYFKSDNLPFWKYDKALDRYLLYPGDLAISLTGTVGKDDYGNICRLGNDYPRYYLNQRNAKLILKDTVLPEFIRTLLKNKKVKDKIVNTGVGIRQANISNKSILELEVPIPNLAGQKQFASLVTQVDKSKLAIQQSLDELETLKKSLMQQYFG